MATKCIKLISVYFLLLTTKLSTRHLSDDPFSGSHLLGYGPEHIDCPVSLASSTFIQEYNHRHNNLPTVYDMFYIHKNNIDYLTEASIFLMGENHDLPEDNALQRYLTDLYGKSGDIFHQEGLDYNYIVEGCKGDQEGHVFFDINSKIFLCRGWENKEVYRAGLELKEKVLNLTKNMTSEHSAMNSKISNDLTDSLKKYDSKILKLFEKMKKAPSITGIQKIAKKIEKYTNKKKKSIAEAMIKRETNSDTMNKKVKALFKEKERLVVKRNKNIAGIALSYSGNHNLFFSTGSAHLTQTIDSQQHPAKQEGPHSGLLTEIKDKTYVIALCP